MQITPRDTGNLQQLGSALLSYIEEMNEQVQQCKRYNDTAAVHRAGKELQVYRIFETTRETADHLHKMIRLLTEEKGPITTQHLALKKQVEQRMKRHSKLHPVATEFVHWDIGPILIHAYKFEPDPILKLELIVPSCSMPSHLLPACLIASLLRLHEELVPEFVAPAKRPYEHHDIAFDTIEEYLHKHTPNDLCLAQYWTPASV